MILSLPRRNDAVARLAQARQEHDELKQQLIEHDQLEAELLTDQSKVLPWAPPCDKARLWEVRELLPQAREMLDQQVQIVESLYRQASAQDSQASAELADLYWHLIERADERGQPLVSQRYLARLAEVDDQGRYATLIAGTARLEVHTEPVGAKLRLCRLTDGGLARPAPDSRRELGFAPMATIELEPGSYLLEVSATGKAPVKRPLVLRRGASLQVRVHLFSPHQVGAQLVQVSASRFAFGGDSAAPGGAPAQQLFVDNFAIARHPVTVGEYLRFLDALARVEPERALALAPEPGKGGASLEAGDPRRPVTGVSYEAAEAFCDWLSASTGVTHRLPTEQEWEKAARGVDGRAYPWGARFDPTFCRTRESVEGGVELCPVGSYGETDVSVYGVADMAGLVAEWTASDFAHERDGTSDDTLKVIRGGSFERCADRCHCAARAPLAPELTAADVGFRVVRPLPPGGGDQLHLAPIPSLASISQAQSDHVAGERIDFAEARAELLAISQRMARVPALEAIDALLSLTVRLVGAERGFVIHRTVDEVARGSLVVCSSRAAGNAAPLPPSDQRFDPHVVRAALDQHRLVELGGGRPTIAAPLPQGDSCLLIERRFSARPFAHDERLLAEAAADLLGLALRIEHGSAPPQLGRPLEDAVADLERDLVTRTLAAERGNISRTARRLGLSRNGLRARLRRFSLSPAEYR